MASLVNGSIRSFEVTPEEAGLSRVGGEALKGGDADANAIALRSVLDGKPGAYRDVALINAAAALIVAGKAKGRTSPDQITLFKSIGIATWDLATAARVYELAKARGMGTQIPLWEIPGAK